MTLTAVGFVGSIDAIEDTITLCFVGYAYAVSTLELVLWTESDIDTSKKKKKTDYLVNNLCFDFHVIYLFEYL